MATIITRLTNTGTFFNNFVFDEVTNQGSGIPERYTPAGYFTNGVLDEVTNLPSGSINFSGTKYLLTTAPLPALKNDFTIEAYVYLTSNLGSAAILSYTGNSSDWDSVGTGVASGLVITQNNLQHPGQVTSLGYPSGTSIGNTLNQWKHIACVRQSGTISVYIGGKFTTSTVNSRTVGGNGINAIVGAFDYYNGFSNPPRFIWPGYITNLRIINGTALYSGTNFTPPTRTLFPISNNNTVMLLNVLSSSTYIIDGGSNNITFTTTSTPTYSSLTPFSPAPQKRITNTACFITGVFDEVTGVS
jgi:hypothetical protein